MARTPTGFPDLDAECREAVVGAAKLLESLGHHVEEAHPDMLDHLAEGPITAFFAVAGSGVAWMLDRWSRLVGKPITASDVEPYTWAFAELGRGISGSALQDGLEALTASARSYAEWWAQGHDLLLTPTIAVPPFELGFLSAPADNPLATLEKAGTICPYTGAYNMSGQPAISLPRAWSRAGLPIGVQLGAAYGREDVLLRIASQLEQARPWADRRPPIHA